jgi:hypothetical protein
MSHFPLRLKTEIGEVEEHSKKAVPEQGFVLSSGQGHPALKAGPPQKGTMNSLATHDPFRHRRNEILSRHDGTDFLALLLVFLDWFEQLLDCPLVEGEALS